MWCDNLPRLRGKLSQVTFPYKVVINTYNVTIEWNPIFFNWARDFYSKLWHVTAFLNIKCKNNKNLEKKCVTTSPGLPYIKFLFLINTFVLSKDNEAINFSKDTENNSTDSLSFSEHYKKNTPEVFNFSCNCYSELKKNEVCRCKLRDCEYPCIREPGYSIIWGMYRDEGLLNNNSDHLSLIIVVIILSSSVVIIFSIKYCGSVVRMYLTPGTAAEERRFGRVSYQVVVHRSRSIRVQYAPPTNVLNHILAVRTTTSSVTLWPS